MHVKRHVLHNTVQGKLHYNCNVFKKLRMLNAGENTLTLKKIQAS